MIFIDDNVNQAFPATSNFYVYFQNDYFRAW